ncbi:hypothetical protein QJU11_09900 [Pasteurella atlantica]|uniref:hypothetical protein n=1 Tax=Phocoenobacter atlanticus TaxID=3416742 RepID=UPI0027639F85|nr:hypothetical protein [Pasteurella atlantica]MDP8042503.1 hypothetical protein [Pasteurella atlantica]
MTTLSDILDKSEFLNVVYKTTSDMDFLFPYFVLVAIFTSIFITSLLLPFSAYQIEKDIKKICEKDKNVAKALKFFFYFLILMLGIIPFITVFIRHL